MDIDQLHALVPLCPTCGAPTKRYMVEAAPSAPRPHVGCKACRYFVALVLTPADGPVKTPPPPAPE